MIKNEGISVGTAVPSVADADSSELGAATRSSWVKLNVFVRSREDYVAQLKPLGEVFRKHFGGHYPTMALFEVSGAFRPTRSSSSRGSPFSTARRRERFRSWRALGGCAREARVPRDAWRRRNPCRCALRERSRLAAGPS